MLQIYDVKFVLQALKHILLLYWALEYELNMNDDCDNIKCNVGLVQIMYVMFIITIDDNVCMFSVET
jgi:hypothetical protein